MRCLIDLYPGAHALEDVPAEFTVEDVPADRWERAGKWATLEAIQIGGLEMPRCQVQLMIGALAMQTIERDVSERLSSNIVGASLRYA
jgi:hypothetical protein